MAVTTEISRSTYTGNGSTTTFAIGFGFLAAAEVVVYVNGIVVVQGVTYNVVGSNVVFVAAPASGAALIVQREVTLTQPTAFRTQGTFSAAVHEDAMDHIVHQAQQLARAYQDQQTDLMSIIVAGVDDTGTTTGAKAMPFGYAPAPNSSYNGMDAPRAGVLRKLSVRVGVGVAFNTEFTVWVNGVMQGSLMLVAYAIYANDGGSSAIPVAEGDRLTVKSNLASAAQGPRYVTFSMGLFRS
jgi:hypothetical protein